MTISNLTTIRKQFADLDLLIEEKHLMEKRLEQLGHDGDCAYEKAMVAFYQRRLNLFNDLIADASVSISH